MEKDFFFEDFHNLVLTILEKEYNKNSYNHGHLARKSYFSMEEDKLLTYTLENSIVQNKILNSDLWARIETVIQHYAFHTSTVLNIITGGLYEGDKMIPFAFYSIIR